MRLLTQSTDYSETIKLADDLIGDYPSAVTFHCFWRGQLTEKQMISIRSCFYFNVRGTNNKIVLWLENNSENFWNYAISQFAEIRIFDLDKEETNTPWQGVGASLRHLVNQQQAPSYSNYVRLLILHNHIGMWFDLDIFFLRSFSPIFASFSDDVFAYRWEYENYPNNAIVGSITDASKTILVEFMHFILERGLGWGFQQANLTFDLSPELLVLPCSWFDPAWIQGPHNIDVFTGTIESYDFGTNFCPGAFCYHWHNQWNRAIEETSVFYQLNRRIIDGLAN